MTSPPFPGNGRAENDEKIAPEGMGAGGMGSGTFYFFGTTGFTYDPLCRLTGLENLRSPTGSVISSYSFVLDGKAGGGRC